MATLERATELLRAGNFHEVVGVSPGASREEGHAACRAAQLRTHPDKGGNADLFNIIQAAVDKLQLDENIYVFNGRTPGWAKTQLNNIAEARHGIEMCERSLKAARDRIDAAMTDGDRAKAMGDAARAERGIRNETEILQESLSDFQACYARHVEDERARKEREAAREARLAVARERQRIEEARADNALRQRRRRQTSTRFPRMPRAVTDAGAWNALDKLRQEYRKVIKTTHKRTQRGSDIKDLEPTAAALMAQARALVDQCCMTAHARAATRWKRFPTLPSSDPRSPALAKLCQEHRKLKNRVKGVMPDDSRHALETQIKEVMNQAASLLEAAGHEDASPSMSQ